MALKTASVPGLWSATATWGGTLPVDNDSVTIPAGISVKMDVDLSAWTGLQTVTVEGSVGTPGMLYWMNGSSGIVKIRTGYHMQGTTGANRGRVVANSDGVYGNTTSLAFATKSIILLEGTSQINAVYLDFQQFPANPTLQQVATYGTKYTVTASGSTLSGATLSNATPVMIQSSGTIPAPLQSDYLYYVVNTSGSTFQLSPVSGGTAVVLTNAGSGTIEVYTGVGSGVTAINVLSDVTADTPWTSAAGHNACVLVSAGQQDYDQQRTTISNIAAGVITLADATDSAQKPGAKIVLVSRNVGIRSSGTSSQAIINAATSGIFGSIRNTSGSGVTYYGYGFYLSTNCNPSGPVSGCTYGFNSCTNCNPSGPVSGCTSGFVSCTNCNPSGPVSGCTSGFSSCTNCNPSGPVSGCTSGFYLSTNCNPSGPVSGCTTDVRFLRYCSIIQRNKSGVLTYSERNGITTVSRISYENYLKVAGAQKIVDNFGDITKVLCGAGAPIPSSGPGGAVGSCLECSAIQSYCGTSFGLDVIRDLRIKVQAGSRTITFKTINTFTGGLPIGGLRLTAQYTDANGDIAVATSNSAALSITTDWSQTVSITFTCLQGWATVTLSLWDYDSSVPLLYVWPIPVIT